MDVVKEYNAIAKGLMRGVAIKEEIATWPKTLDEYYAQWEENGDLWIDSLPARAFRIWYTLSETKDIQSDKQHDFYCSLADEFMGVDLGELESTHDGATHDG